MLGVVMLSVVLCCVSLLHGEVMLSVVLCCSVYHCIAGCSYAECCTMLCVIVHGSVMQSVVLQNVLCSVS